MLSQRVNCRVVRRSELSALLRGASELRNAHMNMQNIRRAVENLDDGCQLSVPAERVRQFDLPRRLTVRGEQARVCDDEDGATRARGSNIQSIEAVQELKSPRRVLRGRGSHGIDGHGRLLPLELVNRSHRDSSWLKFFGQAPDLGIERRND
jgi:hypothetical protein